MTVWIKAAGCAHGDCVEAAALDGRVLVRDSKQSDGPVLTFTPAEWAKAIGWLKNGYAPDGYSWTLATGDVNWDHAGVRLTVSRSDWDAFCVGVDQGEFDVERLTAGAP